MRHFRWSQENEVFLGQIDAEHRDLYRVAEEFEQAIKDNAPLAQRKAHLDSLVAHMQDYFCHEEWIMQSTSYPSYGWHKQQHETARRRLKLFAPLIENGEDEAADLFLEFLSGWLEDHTSVTDRMMGAYVRNYERANGSSAFAGWTGGADAAGSPAPPEPRPCPKTVQFCKTCGEQTTHEMRPGGVVCVKCVGRSVSAELDRD